MSKRSNRKNRRANKERFLKKYATKFARLTVKLREIAKFSTIGVVAVDSMSPHSVNHWSTDPDWALIQFDAKTQCFYEGGLNWTDHTGKLRSRTSYPWTDLSRHNQHFVLSTDTEWFPVKPKTPLQLLAECAEGEL